MKSSSSTQSLNARISLKGLLTFVSRPFLFFLGMLIFMSGSVCSQSISIDPAIKSKANEVIRQIYNDILSEREKYPELADFSESNFSTDPNGNYVIRYMTKVDAGVEKQMPFEFGISFNQESEPNYFQVNEGSFDYSFPILQIKLSGYELKPFKTKQFDIQEFVGRYGQDLWDFQQKYIELKLEITTAKEIYKVDEPIEFTVKLTNNTGKIIKIKDFDEKTMYFVYNRKIWGTRQLRKDEQSKVKDYVLQPNQSLTKAFVGNGFHEKQKVNIYASYGMTFKGVKPSATLSLEIID